MFRTVVHFLHAKKWQNWGGNITVNPFRRKDTSQLDNLALAAALKAATQQPGTLKIVGSGHSFSNILETKGLLLYRSKRSIGAMDSIVQEVDKTVLKSATNDELLIQITGQATLGEINKALKEKGLAFKNLGSAILQTYAGAISTSTHGTGRNIPPLCDDVRSMLMLSPEWGMCRIEPQAGITERMKFEKAYPGIELIQDDKVFYATLVSLGCMGIILEYITCVRPRYKLAETRSFITWSKLKKELRETPGKHLSCRHFDIIINPYRVNGEYSCVITNREIVSNETHNTKAFGKFFQWLVVVLQFLIGRFLRYFPFVIPRFIHLSIKSLVRSKPYIDESNEIFDIDLINKLRAVSAEYVFPLKDNNYLDAIEALIETVSLNSKKKLHQNSPFGIRFVASSKAYLSMMHGEAMCSVEIPLLANTKHWEAVLGSYESICMEYGGRPHWGQYHTLTSIPGWATKSYSKYADWLEVLYQSDPKGAFRNRFTKRMGFKYPK
ncbi:MAG: Oxidoreductase, FAD-binding protein [Ferruginibacter sp.]|nr:Oxidoreductase, FAD-binding protein [Ferruginibacter sp.]